MKHKTLPIAGLKTAGLADGEFEGFASVFGNVDFAGDIVRKGAFAKSIKAGTVTPLIWEHRSDDPRNYVGEVVQARETDEGLAIKGRFDLDTDHGAAAYRAVKGRRITGLSIGYTVRNSTKNADGATELIDLDLLEVSVVARGANDRALIESVKSASPSRSTKARDQLARTKLRIAQPSSKGDTPMTYNRVERLTKARDEQLALAEQIIKDAEELKRDLTESETEEVTAATDGAKKLDEQLRQIKGEQDGFAAAMDLANKIGGPGDGEPAAAGHLAMTGVHAKTMARAMIKALPRNEAGTKALAAGQQTTSVIVQPDVVPTGRPAQSVLDLLPSRVVSPSYAYMRQSARTLNAAPVAVGGTKPTSVVSVQSIEGRLRVVAHVSEQIDHYLLSDNTNLEAFVAQELVFGLRRAVEAEILAGDGTGEHMTGVLNTSGIVVQAYATDKLTSIRKALTSLDVSGYAAGAIVLSAADWEAIELLEATSGATDVRGVPIDTVARRLWGVPVALNEGLGAKTGLVIGEGAVTVDHDGVVDTRWSEAVSDDFVKNFVRARVEGRFNVSVSQPGAVVKVGTAA